MRILKLFALLLSAVASSPAFAQKNPNILIIVSDDHAVQAIGAYGNKLAHTPAIDRIASEGAVFQNAYVTNSICGPSRAVILTGKYSHKNGFTDNEHSRFDGSQNTFIKELSRHGYQTAWIGKWHLGTNPQGFTHWQILPGQGQYYNPDFIRMDGNRVTREGYVTNIIEDLAENWLDSRDTSKPFCLVIGHKATHRTWIPDTCDMGLYDNVNFPLPETFHDNYSTRQAAALQDMSISKTLIMGYDLKMFGSDSAANADGNISRMNPRQREYFDNYYNKIYKELKAQNLSGKVLTEWKFQRYMRDYFSTVVSLDRNIGRALDYLDKNNLAENTIVIYLSDQGFFMGEHGWFDKRWMYEESFRTPMIMRYPGKIKPGTVNSDFVMNLDIAPTVLEAAAIPVPDDMQGESFLSHVTNGKKKSREALYYHYYENGEHAVSPQFGVKTRRYKLIRYYKRVEAWELFDLETDQHELNNLYGKKGYEKITAELKRELLKQIRKYEDSDAELILTKEAGNS